MTNDRIRNLICTMIVASVSILFFGPLAHAAVEPRPILKTYFETGDVPTQDQFSNLIDSYIHQTDDGLTLTGIAATADGSAAGLAIRVGDNVGINELLPDTFSGTWKSPTSTALPRIYARFGGTSGFLPLKYEGPDGAAHYGFLQIDVGIDPGVSPGAPIYVTQWVWDSSADATLTTFGVPEPTTAALFSVGLIPALGSRRRRYLPKSL